MNDNDIIKALECCTQSGCIGCPLYTPEHTGTCVKRVFINALDLINRQRAEIERLKTKLSHSIGIDNTDKNGCFPFD